MSTMLGGRVDILVCFMLYISCVSGMAINDMCGGEGQLQNPKGDGSLEYVKQNSTWVNHTFVIEGQYTSVAPCEVHNFCTMEWFDNDTQQPIQDEPGYIKIKGDRLLIEEARLTDTRFYTCKASQGSISLKPRTILVQVIEQNTEGLTHLPHPHCVDKSADLGGSVTIYCEYSVGDVDCPWAFATWYKQNGTDGDFQTISNWNRYIDDDPDVTTVYGAKSGIKADERELSDGKPVYVYDTTLTLSNISEEAFGTYRVLFTDGFGSFKEHNLSITKNPDPEVKHTQGIIEVVIGLVVLLVISAILATMIYTYGVDIKLYWKDNYSKESRLDDGKKIDAYISYFSGYGKEEEDLNFVIKELKPKLESQRYIVVIREINHIGTDKFTAIVKSLETCRRCILVISPSYLTASEEDFEVNMVLEKVESCKKQIIPIMFKDLDDSKTSDTAKLLNHILEISHPLKWPQKAQNETTEHFPQVDKKTERKQESVCKELMLRMPPRPKAPPNISASMSQVEMLANEERRSSLPSPDAGTFQNGFQSMYPNLNPGESSSNGANTTPLPELDEIAQNLKVPTSKSTGLYPVIT